MVKEIWESVADGEDVMRQWQTRIRRLRQHLIGWAKNVSGANKKGEKGYLISLMC
jgi:hypothetical protein